MFIQSEIERLEIKKEKEGLTEDKEESLCDYKGSLQSLEAERAFLNCEQKRNIGERIRKIRELKGLTMMELGLKIKVSEQAIFYYENGKRQLSIENIKEIAETLNVPITELVEDPIQINLAEDMKKYRTLRGFTQKELATALGVSKITIQNYENNRRIPNIKLLNKIVNVLDINVLSSTETKNDYITET